MNHASLFRMSSVASPKQSLSKISGYRPHKVSQIESLPQTWVIKPTMLARSEDKRRATDGQRRAVCERGERARDSARERPNTRKYASKQSDSTVSTCRSCSHSKRLFVGMQSERCTSLLVIHRVVNVDGLWGIQSHEFHDVQQSKGRERSY